MMIKIAPSVLACDLSRLAQEALAMERAGADMLHLDVMDGHFVPNMSFGPPVIKKLRPYTKLFFDAHLMISEPMKYLEAFADAGCDGVTFHAECGWIGETIRRIKSLGMRPGVSIKPSTPPEILLPYIKEISMVLVMTVEPGFGGQSYMPGMGGKISLLHGAIQASASEADIQVDGGIDQNTATHAAELGANVFVAGTSLFGSDDYAGAVKRLRITTEGAFPRL